MCGTVSADPPGKVETEIERAVGPRQKAVSAHLLPAVVFCLSEKEKKHGVGQQGAVRVRAAAERAEVQCARAAAHSCPGRRRSCRRAAPHVCSVGRSRSTPTAAAG